MQKTGFLFINLGSPAKSNYFAIRDFLLEFLSDIRVVELNRFIWIPILYIICLIRPISKKNEYKKIWVEKSNTSPLLHYTDSLINRIIKINTENNIIVDYAMRYGKPSINDKIRNFKKLNVDNIIIIPSYPQYCSATTATVVDKVSDALKKLRWQPNIKFIEPWYKNEKYINLISKKIIDNLKKYENTEYLIISYHGMPLNYIEKGDPYYCHCLNTSHEISKNIKIPVITTFQSRFGTEKWIMPYTDYTIKNLAKNGVKNIAIIAPGFTVDCLETIEELCEENKEIFIENGGKHFYYIDCLNDSEDALNFFNESVIKKYLT